MPVLVVRRRGRRVIEIAQGQRIAFAGKAVTMILATLGMCCSKPITVLEFTVTLSSLREVVLPFETCRECWLFRFIGDPDDAEENAS